MGSVPLRVNLEREVLVEVRDGGTVLTSGVSQMPPVAKPSGDNVALGEATFAPPLVYVVVNNTGNADVTGVSLHMQGLPDMEGSQPVSIMSTGIPCLPAGGAALPSSPCPPRLLPRTRSACRPRRRFRKSPKRSIRDRDRSDPKGWGEKRSQGDVGQILNYFYLSS